MNRRMPWWQIFSAVPLLVGLFVGEHRLRLSPAGHQTVQVIIVLFVFGLVSLWLKAHEATLVQEEVDRHQMVFEAREDPAEGHESDEFAAQVNPAAFGAPLTRGVSSHLPPIEGHPVEPPFHHSLN